MPIHRHLTCNYQPPHQLLNRRRLPLLCTRQTQADPRSDPHSPEKLGFLHVATITAPHGVFGAVKATSTSDFAEHRLSPHSSTQRYILLPGRRYPRPVSILSARRASRQQVWILQLGDILRFGRVSAPEDIQRLRLRGAQIYVRAQDRPPLARGEFVVADLVDMRVALRESTFEPATPDNEPSAEAYYVARKRRGAVIAAGNPIGVVESIITGKELCRASGSGASSAAVANDLLEIALFEHPALNDEQSFAVEIPEEATRVLVPFVRQIVPVVDQSVSLVVLDPPPGLFSATVVNRSAKPRPPRGLLMAAREGTMSTDTTAEMAVNNRLEDGNEGKGRVKKG